MAKADDAWTRLATCIPKELHRRLRVCCVAHDIVLMHFVAAAIEEKLARSKPLTVHRTGSSPDTVLGRVHRYARRACLAG
jgi:hypothetical protein